MRLFACLIITGFLLFQPALAKQNNSQDSELIEQGDYINSDGQSVHKPAHSKSGNIPEGASAQCRDGTYSFSTHHRGTCSRHGGVAQWLE
ncbi:MULTISPECIES: DUF3761 domain-containing protein [Rahnella]|uniref:DUF3761 domain-containing protein n=1 Tax=Rahnella laticis TaxID=2787622 RepID=A0ABS0E1K9_9GAMM|nr:MULTISPECIES: DUF3761 domain-containing protein [Rahnella]MBF7978955.1 DUF3761 domain-containing protein [Rahnella laticis]MBF7997595.1 DUF3761 domain-containing protein [Rahnella laticis]MBF7999045.1 DUF3761 domain-containing protein [Rahnella sp. LAC-M12]MBV6818120.1 DUF3761 domain-containing protein [Rahnella sp. PD12R]